MRVRTAEDAIDEIAHLLVKGSGLTLEPKQSPPEGWFDFQAHVEALARAVRRIDRTAACHVDVAGAIINGCLLAPQSELHHFRSMVLVELRVARSHVASLASMSQKKPAAVG